MLVTLGTIQLASDAFIRAPGTFSALIPAAFGVRVYEFLDRVAPAAYVDETLAEAALDDGDLPRAQHFAIRLQEGPRRDDLLGRIAQARGETMLAMEYYFAAPDVARMQSSIKTLARTDASSAYDIERRFGAHVQSLQTHPDAVADAWFMAGSLANQLHRPDDALRAFEAAAQLAPLDVKYLLGVANEAFVSHRYAIATTYYRRGLAVNPACGDCYAGLGVVALRQGRRAEALGDRAKANAVQPDSQMLRELDKELRAR